MYVLEMGDTEMTIKMASPYVCPGDERHRGDNQDGQSICMSWRRATQR